MSVWGVSWERRYVPQRGSVVSANGQRGSVVQGVGYHGTFSTSNFSFGNIVEKYSETTRYGYREGFWNGIVGSKKAERKASLRIVTVRQL